VKQGQPALLLEANSSWFAPSAQGVQHLILLNYSSG